MNKNTILALSLILLTLIFFNSPLYNKMYEKIFKKTRTTFQQTQNTTPSPQAYKENSIKKDTVFLKESGVAQQRKAAFKNGTISEAVSEKITADTLWVENEKYICGISEIGAKIVSLKMKDYHYSTIQDRKDTVAPLVDLVANGNLGGANLMINGQDYDEKKFTLGNKEKRINISKNETRTIDFTYTYDDKATIVKEFRFTGDSYKIGYSVINGSLDGKSIVVGWEAGIAESENRGQNVKSASGVNEPRKVHVLDINNNVTHFQFKKRTR